MVRLPSGEYRLPGEDGAHYQSVAHPRQPLGPVLQPVPRARGDLHTGTAQTRRRQLLAAQDHGKMPATTRDGGSLMGPHQR